MADGVGVEVCFEAGGDPVRIGSGAASDELLDEIAVRYRDDWPVLVEVDIADSVDTEQLYVGVYRDSGVVSYTSPDHPGCYSLGESAGDGELTYYYMRNERQFPANAQVPLATVKLAVREFLATNGRRPTGLAWQNG